MHKTDNLSLAAKVAELYYVEQKTQVEISKIIGRSRPTVIRLLKLARDRDLIDIYIRDIAAPEEKAEQLVQRLCGVFGILDERYTRILYTHSVGDILIERTGKLAAEVLEEIIFDKHKEKSSDPNESPRVRLGVGFGTQLSYVTDFANPRRSCEDLMVIPLIGGFGRGEEMRKNDSNELARRIAKHYRGTAEELLCPAKVSSPEVKRTLEREEVISHVMRAGKNCDIHTFGVGGIRSEAKTEVKVQAGLVTEDLLIQMARTRGVVGTMYSQMYTIDGEACPYPEENGALMSISLDDLKRSIGNGSHVLAVAGYGETRYRGVLGALRTGCVNCIVTDQRCAEWVIEQEEGKQSQ